MMWPYSLAGAMGAVVIFAIAWVRGYNEGVKDTEERWSDAVSRK